MIYIYISFSNREKQLTGEFTPVEVAVLKGRTSKSSLGGKIMSTEFLTTVVSIALIAGLFVVSVMELYKRRLAKSALSASAMCAALHVAFVYLAWSELAIAYLNAPLSARRWEVEPPSISLLPTAAYDASAWASVIFFTLAIVLRAVEFRRRKAAEKEMAAFLTDLFGADEDTKPEKSEED